MKKISSEEDYVSALTQLDVITEIAKQRPLEYQERTIYQILYMMIGKWEEDHLIKKAKH